QIGSLGISGGMFTGMRGQPGDSRLDFPRAVGTDAAGNVYVAGGYSGADLRKFSPSGEMAWQILGLQFVDCIAADPLSDGQNVYSKTNRFSMDYTRHNGQEWKWMGTTVDLFRYPSDPRISSNFPNTSLTAYAVRYL